MRLTPLSRLFHNPKPLTFSPACFITASPHGCARYDVIGANGGLWFYIPPMVTFFLLLSDLVGEKEQRSEK